MESYSLSLFDPPNNYIIYDEKSQKFIVSQNSHSVAYSFLTYYTAWLKYKFPHIFIAESLIEESKEDDAELSIADFVKECRALDIKLIPPLLNASGITYTPWEDVDHNRYITLGLKAIDKLGDKIAAEIIEERDANGKFTSMQNMIERGISRKDVIVNLIKVGAMDDIPILEGQPLSNRMTMLKSFDIIHKWSQRNKARLKNSKEETRAPLPLEIDLEELSKDTRDFTIQEIMVIEQTTLKMYITANVLDAYILPDDTCTPTVAREHNIIKGKYVGIVTNRRSLMTRKNTPYLIFDLYDGMESLLCFYFYDDKSEKDIENIGKLSNNAAVCIGGKIGNRGSVNVESVLLLTLKVTE